MQIQPITSFSNNKNTSFKSKLPSVNCVYNSKTIGTKDYWGEFAKNCMKENKTPGLQNLLVKLTSNFDKNFLSLTTSLVHKTGLKTPSGEIIGKYYQFTLHSNPKSLDLTKPHSNVFIVDKFDSKWAYENNKIGSRYVSSCDFDYDKNESITNVLLKTLKNIVTPNTKSNSEIYSGLDTKEENFLKDFRA